MSWWQALWQVLDSSRLGLSRGFYSPILLFESYANDLRLCVPMRDLGPPPSTMRPWEPDSGAVRAADEGGGSTDEEGAGHGRAEKSTDGEGRSGIQTVRRSGMPTVRPAFWL